jgi:hypothetical protein
VEPIPVVAPEKSELPVEATSVAFAGVNGSPVRETVPSEEAARIIEAVLTHVAGQRGDMGAMPQFVRHIAPVTQPSEKVVLPAEGKSMEEETGTVSTGALEKVAEVKVADGAQVAPGESKLDKKQNFVRRWFVGRAQS